MNSMKKKENHLQSKELHIPLRFAYIGVGALFIVLAVIGGIYFTAKKKVITNNATKSVDEIKKLEMEVGAIFDLPKGESPTVATVSDKAKLKGQSFFAKAENGDKVLIYTNAKKAILYRPSLGKIMEVSSLNLSVQPSPTGSAIEPTLSPTSVQTVRVSIYNGTKIPNLASNTEKTLTSTFFNIEVVETLNAENDYKKTIVVDVTGTNKDMVKKLADNLGGTVSVLPENEVKPDADILIVLGE